MFVSLCAVVIPGARLWLESDGGNSMFQALNTGRRHAWLRCLPSCPWCSPGWLCSRLLCSPFCLIGDASSVYAAALGAFPFLRQGRSSDIQSIAQDEHLTWVHSCLALSLNCAGMRTRCNGSSTFICIAENDKWALSWTHTFILRKH